MDFEQKQLEIEAEGRTAGIKRYYDAVAKRPLAEMPPGTVLMKNLLASVQEALQDYVENPRKGGNSGISKLHTLHDVGYDVAAYVTLQRLLNGNAQSIGSLESQIGLAIETELWMSQYAEANEKKFNWKYREVISETHQRSRQRTRMTKAARKHQVQRPDWGDNYGKDGAKSKIRSSIGQICLNLALEVCGGTKYDEVAKAEISAMRDAITAGTATQEDLATLRAALNKKNWHRYFLVEPRKEHTVTNGSGRSKVKTKKTNYLIHSPLLEEMIARDHKNCALLSPIYPPMVVPPVDWHVEQTEDGTCELVGGYLSIRRPLLKNTRLDYLQDDLREGRLDDFLDAVNCIQQSPRRINRAVLEVLEQIWDAGGGCAGLPAREDPPLPAKPAGYEADPENYPEKYPEIWREYLKTAEAHYRAINSLELKAKRHEAARKLDIARRFVDEPELFFPVDCDWRGRVYPMPNFLHDQADSVAKGLLEHAHGLPIDERSAIWLAVHGANSYEAKVPGCNPDADDKIDKASFSDRVKWVHDNEDKILHAAAFPMESDFWVAAEKPAEFLAFCFEWAGWVIQGPGFVSHMNIGADGSNNGLQWYSALLLNEEMAREVNLLPGERPRDVYAKVAQAVAPIVSRDAIAGKDSEIAKLLQGKVTRKVAKRPLMTRPYGSTSLIAMRKQLTEAGLEKSGGFLQDIPKELRYKVTSYLARVLDGAIRQEAAAANVGMRFFKDIARLATAAGRDIVWTVPDGLRIHQRYEKMKLTKVRTTLNGSIWVKPKKVSAYVVETTGKVDKTKQLRCPPNVVHSFDACMLRIVVRRLRDLGITGFIGVHDSYGTHAANFETMQQVIREVFVSMCSQPLLKMFADEVLADIPEKLKRKVPEVPAMGNLDLAQVLDSDYFFA